MASRWSVCQDGQLSTGLSTCRTAWQFTVICGVFLLCASLTAGNRNNPSNVHNANITRLLDGLLRGYNKHLRPDYGGETLEVFTNILIRSMGPVSEELMMFSLDCYFRQYWKDSRLKYTPIDNITQLRPSIAMLNEIWKPDTFFLNGKDSYLHTITYSNKLFRIDPSGDITYSQRLTIKTSCPMRLEKYPLDTQICPLMLGSYGYVTKDVLYRWVNKSAPAVKLYSDIRMAQFTLKDLRYKSDYMTKENHGLRKVLWVEFEMSREIGFYLLQFYLPCYLIVIISWVSFWINRESTPARVTLGITTLLTTCTIAITGRTGIPKVSYSTALDIYLLMCFSFVFAALIEYAGVHFFTKTASKDVPDDSDDEPDAHMPLLTNATYTTQGIRHTVTTDINGHTTVTASTADTGLDASSGGRPRSESCWSMFWHCLKGNTQYKHFKSLSKTGSLSVSKIDSMARIMFPFSFICLNILYWAGYMYYF